MPFLPNIGLAPAPYHADTEPISDEEIERLRAILGAPQEEAPFIPAVEPDYVEPEYAPLPYIPPEVYSPPSQEAFDEGPAYSEPAPAPYIRPADEPFVPRRRTDIVIGPSPEPPSAPTMPRPTYEIDDPRLAEAPYTGPRPREYDPDRPISSVNLLEGPLHLLEELGKPAAAAAGATLAVVPGGALQAEAQAEIRKRVKARNPQNAAEALSSLYESAAEYERERPESFAGEKFVLEMLVDPLNLIGIGLEPRIARATVDLAKRGGRLAREAAASPAVRRFIESEQGGIRLPDTGGGLGPLDDLRYKLESGLDQAMQNADEEAYNAISKRLEALEQTEIGLADVIPGARSAAPTTDEVLANPLRKYLDLLPNSGPNKGVFGETASPATFERLKGNKPSTDLTVKKGKQKGRVDWIYIVDEFAQEAGYANSETFMRDLEQLWRDSREAGVSTINISRGTTGN